MYDSTQVNGTQENGTQENSTQANGTQESVKIKDVAQHAGVSSATVSRVLGNKPYVKDDVRDKVLESVKKLGYRPSRIAQSLRTQRSKVIGLIVSDIQNSFFTSIVRAVEDVASEQGYGVFLCNTDENPEKEQFYVDLLLDEQVAGIVMVPTREQETACNQIVQIGTPLVIVDRRIFDIEVDTVVTNNREVSYKLVKALITQGHTNIAAILPDLRITTGRERHQGMIEALTEADIEFDSELLFIGAPTIESGYKLTKTLLEQESLPSAVFLGTKLMTLGALRAFHEKNIEVSKDMAIASFDKLDVLPYQPEYFYAEQPTYALGESAAKLLMEKIENPAKPRQEITLSSEVMI